MTRLHFEQPINAPREKVWQVLLGPDTYKKWTVPFNPPGSTSRMEGDWSNGSKMLFIGKDEQTGEEGGMVSRIAENKPNEFLSIEHLGILKNGVEDTTSEEAKKWAPAYENYTLQEKDGGTLLLIDMDAEDSYAEQFKQMWEAALKIVKELSESGAA